MWNFEVSHFSSRKTVDQGTWFLRITRSSYKWKIKRNRSSRATTRLISTGFEEVIPCEFATLYISRSTLVLSKSHTTIRRGRGKLHRDIKKAGDRICQPATRQLSLRLAQIHCGVKVTPRDSLEWSRLGSKRPSSSFG